MNAHRNPHHVYLALFFVPALGLGAAGHFGLGLGPLVAWLLAANLTTFPMWAWDKRRARTGGGRVPELVLHTMAAVGSTPASFLAMSLLRHKTQKRIFGVLYAIFLIAQVALALWWFGRGTS